MKVLAATTVSNTTHYLHDPMGIHSQAAPTGDKTWHIRDGLGSVRGGVDSMLATTWSESFSPYGEPFGSAGTDGSVFGYTGEMMDANDLVYLRARYYVPEMGVFPGLDPVEFVNRYGYVNGNVINRVDPSGLCDISLCLAALVAPVDGPVADLALCTCLAIRLLALATISIFVSDPELERELNNANISAEDALRMLEGLIPYAAPNLDEELYDSRDRRTPDLTVISGGGNSPAPEYNPEPVSTVWPVPFHNREWAPQAQAAPEPGSMNQPQSNPEPTIISPTSTPCTPTPTATPSHQCTVADFGPGSNFDEVNALLYRFPECKIILLEDSDKANLLRVTYMNNDRVEIVQANFGHQNALSQQVDWGFFIYPDNNSENSIPYAIQYHIRSGGLIYIITEMEARFERLQGRLVNMVRWHQIHQGVSLTRIQSPEHNGPQINLPDSEYNEYGLVYDMYGSKL